MRRFFGFFLLVVPFFLAPVLAVSLSVWRSVPAGIVSGVVVSGVAAVVAWKVAARSIPLWAFRFWLVVAVPAWGATLALLGVAYMATALDRHLQYGSDYCWEPPTFTATKACVGRDHSLLQGRLRYAEAIGVPKPDLCRALLAGTPPVVCERDKPFKSVPCPESYAQGWQCFGCEYVSGAYDRYRVWNFVRSDCAEAVAWRGVNVSVDEMPERLRPLR